MNVTFPIRLDGPTKIRLQSRGVVTVDEITENDVAEGFEILDDNGNLSKVNGYDSSILNDGRGRRVTNYTGAAGGRLMKKCPHCEAIKDLVEFGDSRTTNELRDQSHCNQCRADAF